MELPPDDGGLTPPVLGSAPPLEPPPVPVPVPPPVPPVPVPPVGACGAGEDWPPPALEGALGVLDPPTEPLPDEPDDELPESPLFELLELFEGAGFPVTGGGA